MKHVKLLDLEDTSLAFMRRVISTLPSTGHKFAAGVMLATYMEKIEKFLMSFADKDGNVDLDMIRSAVKSGFSEAGSRVTFTVGDDRVGWLLKSVNITITSEDVETSLSELEARYAAMASTSPSQP